MNSAVVAEKRAVEVINSVDLDLWGIFDEIFTVIFFKWIWDLDMGVD